MDTYLAPEGFQLTAAEKDQFGYYMVFQSGDSKETIRLLEYTSDSGFSFDTETIKMEHVKIGFSDGYYLRKVQTKGPLYATAMMKN